MNRAIVPRDIACLACKKQRIFHWTPQFLLRSVCPDFAVAVSPPGKRIGLPIVKVRSLKPPRQILDAETKQLSQRL